jgi:predicted Kef-type K+ transport protein
VATHAAQQAAGSVMFLNVSSPAVPHAIFVLLSQLFRSHAAALESPPLSRLLFVPLFTSVAVSVAGKWVSPDGFSAYQFSPVLAAVAGMQLAGLVTNWLSRYIGWSFSHRIVWSGLCVSVLERGVDTRRVQVLQSRG